MEQVSLCSIGHDELLVRMVASGVCHTDVVFGDNAGDIGGYPRIMGHEGNNRPDVLCPRRQKPFVRC